MILNAMVGYAQHWRGIEMKALTSVLIIIELLAGCSKKSAPNFVPDPQGWLIES
jgi:hypothetical protein